MEPDMPMILPKGIVVNTKGIYEEVAKYRHVPADRVWEIWRVYTTTTKKLQDPTARRLENFWWHVLGSDRQRLSGETLATLYENISLGPTFVPLRGPPNRWEGDDVPPLIRQAMAILESEQSKLQPQSETALNKTKTPGLRDLSASAAKPPPTHPILKKPRGPSSSGPRPTARFVSPQVSDDEQDEASDLPSSGNTITPGLEMRSNVVSPPKKKFVGKKFTASKPASKRRPILPRKSSSNTSTSSDQGPRDGTPSSSSRDFGVPQRPVSPIVETSPVHTPTASSKSPKLSAKAAGKRPMLPQQTIAERRELPAQTLSTSLKYDSRRPEPDSPGIYVAAAPSSGSHDVERLKTRPQSLANLSGYGEQMNGSPRSAAADTGSRLIGQQSLSSVPMATSRSYSGYTQRGRDSPRLASHGLFTGATASTTNVAAQGMIIDQSGINQIPDSSFFDSLPSQSESRVGSYSSSLLEPRLTPTQPTHSASVPLGRTRSQLTLLLDRENEARASRKPRSKK